MKAKDYYKFIDHTNLSREADWQQLVQLGQEAIEFGAASVCVQPSYVKELKEHFGDKLRICTVIGFPFGYNTTASKVFEAKDAIANGADEIDMVINNLQVKDRRFDLIKTEIEAIRQACPPPVILKVIVETALLSKEDLSRLSVIVSESGADYIKTSTGYSTSGAKLEDIALMRASKSPKLKIKAAGGIRSYEQVKAFVAAGCDRIGASSALKAIKLAEASERGLTS